LNPVLDLPQSTTPPLFKDVRKQNTFFKVKKLIIEKISTAALQICRAACQTQQA
jgi:hypothetical protein